MKCQGLFAGKRGHQPDHEKQNHPHHRGTTGIGRPPPNSCAEGAKIIVTDATRDTRAVQRELPASLLSSPTPDRSAPPSRWRRNQKHVDHLDGRSHAGIATFTR